MEFISEPFFPYLIAALIGLAIYSHFSEKKRSQELKLLATEMNFDFSNLIRPNTKNKLDCFNLFNQGHSKCFKNEIWGLGHGNNISIFEYSYTLGHGKYRKIYNQTALLIQCNDFYFPEFELKPESLFDKVKEMFGAQDIDFESYPKFSKKYLLRGKNEDEIRTIFPLKVIRFFESKHNFCTEAKGNYFLFYKSSERCEPYQISEFIETGQRVLTRFINT